MSWQIHQQPVQINSSLTVLSSVNVSGNATFTNTFVVEGPAEFTGQFDAPNGNVAFAVDATNAVNAVNATNATTASNAVSANDAITATRSNRDFTVPTGYFYRGDGSKLTNVNGALGYNANGAGNNIIPSKGSNQINSGTYSGILGGQNNIMQNNDSFIIGSDIISSQDKTTFVENLFALSAIYGGGNEVVMSDGSNDNGNGPNTLTINFSSGNYFTNTTYFSGISASGRTVVANLTARNLEISGNTGVSSFFVLRDSTGKRWKFGTTTSGQLTALGAA